MHAQNMGSLDQTNRVFHIHSQPQYNLILMLTHCCVHDSVFFYASITAAVGELAECTIQRRAVDNINLKPHQERCNAFKVSKGIEPLLLAHIINQVPTC